MHLTLEVKRYHEFFWLRDIRGVDISKCCAECFLGGKDNRVYYGTLFVDNHNIRVTITDARRIEFADYKPNPPGFYTRRQRTCRNWIFANYINDGMLRR